MTKNEALLFLEHHQPMPADTALTQELIDVYDEVRQYFVAHPAKEAIILFLRSFGEGDGWGVYQLVEDVFYKCDSSDVIMSLRLILEDESVSDSVRYWSTQSAAAFCNEALRKGINISLASKNEDIKEAAELAISVLEDNAKNPE